jgi:hypothetical protein
MRSRPSIHDEPRDEMKIGARIDLVRDSGRDDRQNIRGALGAVVEPCK